MSKKTLAFFNNKGGVGKTTLACNFAHYASTQRGMNTLVVDLDPQANATQLLLTDEDWIKIYGDTEQSASKTILKAFSHIFEGDSGVDSEISLHRSERFAVDVLAGHPGLSLAEDLLSSAWVDLKGELVGGARQTNWLNALQSTLSYDLIVIDLGPSLGALNRSALIGSTNLMTPVATDLFSMFALENIGDWITRWTAEYENALSRTRSTHSTSKWLKNFPDNPGVTQGYIGYTTQQYIARRNGGEIRPTAAYERYSDEIPERSAHLRSMGAPKVGSFDLGVIPYMFSMVALAQSVHSPIAELKSGSEVRGAQVNQKKNYEEQLTRIFSNIYDNLNGE